MSKQILNIAFISAVLLLLTVDSFAKETLSPKYLKGTDKVSAEELIQHYEVTPTLTIIDSRIKSDRLQGYIEGSYSLPDTETSCVTLAKVLSNKNSAVTFYCNGPKCGRSYIASKIAIQCGYKNIFWFRGGLEEWKQKKYPLVTD